MGGPGIPDDADRRRQLALALWNVRKAVVLPVPGEHAVWYTFASEALAESVSFPREHPWWDALIVEMNKAAIRAALEVIKADLAK